jgi:hypothetical protein
MRERRQKSEYRIQNGRARVRQSILTSDFWILNSRNLREC